jgi:hypothetical protein
MTDKRMMWKLIGLCERIEHARLPLCTNGLPKRIVKRALRLRLVSLVVVEIGHKQWDALVTTEAGYLMSKATSLVDADRALEVPALLGYV